MRTFTRQSVKDLAINEKLFITYKSENLKEYHIEIERWGEYWTLTKYHTKSNYKLFKCDSSLKDLNFEVFTISYTTILKYNKEELKYSDFEIIDKP